MVVGVDLTADGDNLYEQHVAIYTPEQLKEWASSVRYIAEQYQKYIWHLSLAALSHPDQFHQTHWPLPWSVSSDAMPANYT